MVVAAVLLVALFQVRLGAPVPEEPETPDDFTPLIPRAPVEGDVNLDPLDGDRMPMLPDLDEGGWIEAYDRESGRLAQRYRFERLDPNPPNLPPEWAQFTRPHVEVFSEGGRVLVITAETAMVHRPHGLLKSGWLVGDVTIRQFEPPEGRAPNPSRDTPTLLVRTPRADFDNFLGQVRADGSFRIEAPTAEFMGRRLTILINDRDQHIQELAVAEVDFVRFTQGFQSATEEDEPTPPTRPAAPVAERGAPVTETDSPPPASADVVFYRLTLRENVRVEDGTRTLTGDTLRVVFSNESEALGGTFARAPSPPRLPATVTFLAAALGYQPATAGPPTTKLAPPRAPDDVWITCSGGLLMVPETDGKELPASPRDTRLTLQGAPARLRDTTEGRDLEARCSAMVYEALERTVRLVGTRTNRLEIESARFNASGEIFYYRDTDARGGFTGPGTLTLVVREQDLDVEWNHSVDLAFAPGEGDEGPGPLEQAVFRGSAVAAGDDGRIAAETLDLGLALNGQGETVPATLLAVSNVRAEDPDRTIWADRLDAEFADEPRRDAEANAGTLGAAPIERFSASGAVQVALGRDGRLFADRIDGTEGGAHVVATGAPLMVAQGGWLLDKGTRLVLDDTEQTAHWDGPGRARVYANPLLTANERRTVPPTPTADPQLVATWQQALLFDAAAREGAGDVHLTGGVRVDSNPEPFEHSILEGDEVTLELVASEDPPAGGQEAGLIGEDRALDRIIARGEARLESRRWENDRREGPARVFFVAG
ncbi:MAG: hypothetical protein ACYS0D_10130, partial [Planctomycetota bacterium]